MRKKLQMNKRVAWNRGLKGILSEEAKKRIGEAVSVRLKARKRIRLIRRR